MRPDVPHVIDAALLTLNDLSANVTSSDDAARIQGLQTLLFILQRQWDGAAAGRVAVINRYSEIVSRGTRLAHEPLRTRLAGSLKTPAEGAEDFRISSLEARLDLLREAVRELQEWLEVADSPEARELLDAVWQSEYEDAKSRVGFENVF
jgi:hypothetical protein